MAELVHNDPLCGCYVGRDHTCGPGYCRDCDRDPTICNEDSPYDYLDVAPRDWEK